MKDSDLVWLTGLLNPELETKHVGIINKYERCSFCNTKLLFTHDLNLMYFQVVENSRCPGCGVVMKSQRFSLH